MSNFNRVLLMGRLTHDLELKRPSGQPVADIGLAINRSFKTRDGEKREEVTFVDCEAWGRSAEAMAQHLHKGSPVFIEGRLKLDQWEDRETGKTRTKLKVVIENFQFVGGRGESAPASRSPAAGAGHGVDEPEVSF